jgi:hypothetical protein
MKKKFEFLSFIFILLAVNGFSQSIAIDKIKDLPSSWTKLTETTNVLVNYQYVECNVPADGLYADYVFLQFENKTNKTITISWEPELYYGGICATCNASGFEKKYTISLAPQETKIPNCDFTDDEARKMRVFIKWNQVENKRVLSSFALLNLITSTKPHNHE